MSRSGTNSPMILFLRFQTKMNEERIQMDAYKYDTEPVQKQEEKKTETKARDLRFEISKQIPCLHPIRSKVQTKRRQ
jgi:hypothetical protein